jgi:hypothetical protein
MKSSNRTATGKRQNEFGALKVLIPIEFSFFGKYDSSLKFPLEGITLISIALSTIP